MTRSSSYRNWIATALAHAFLADAAQAGGRSAEALHARAVQCMGEDAPWLRALAASIATEFSRRRDAHTVPTLSAWLCELPQLDDAFDPEREHPRVRRLLLRPARMVRAPCALEGLRLPRWDTPADLAAWLGVPLERLEWLVGRAQDFRETQAGRTRSAHYHPLLKAKRSGGLRLIEIPKPALKQVQQKLLSGLLDAIPTHESVHGFVRGRSAISHAREHAGRAVVIAFDLRDFFNSIGVARVRALWRTLGYAEGVAEALARLTTTRTPLAVRERLVEAGGIDFMAAKRLASRHLPQGAPTSPALANLCAFGLDLRLDGLAWRFGAHYSRYADDIVFSGPRELAARSRNLQAWVEAIVRAEGFTLHPGKTRRMRAHHRQQVTGVVVNERPNVARDAYDRLRARLHSCAASGCDAETWMQLQGQVGWACQLVAASRAEKLQRMLAAVPVRR
ncbi:RNA-directed DNA polymerase [Ramlibacter sp. USB13]|uniref:RNA-directed DNA polymerase n=1 Tax=Ramlibacter cellulosilyticus TaxID=2764187 RepID=A0A923MN07_9BURK|nr:reverse transcriptase family protein [Ramlibacter cellulosilyticus]MBC5782330.1 RNA-directed DNA polymerase [Ramlibacter cellulosilyticus]